MQAKECVTESHSSDPHSLLQLNEKEFASWVCLQYCICYEQARKS